MTRYPGRSIRSAVVALFLLSVGASAADSAGRVVAVGDIHGAYTEFVSVLQRAGLIDKDTNWSGGDTTFVQNGDVLDRGPDSRKALDLLIKLQQQAPLQHGRVITLLGNHEAMDMTGDLRYVSAAEYQAYATPQSEAVREKAYQDYRKFLAGHQGAPKGAEEAAFREKWMAEHPLGYFELRDAYGPEGEYGKWFRQHDAVAEIDGIAFLHAGLDPELGFKSLKDINQHVHEELADFDGLWRRLAQQGIIWRYSSLEEAYSQIQDAAKAHQAGTRTLSPSTLEDMQKLFRGLQHWYITSPTGPLWYRGLATDPEPSLDSKLTAMLARLKVTRIVVGHTVVSRTGILTRFNNRVFLIDTGMLADYFHGRASALEIQGDKFTAIYGDGEQQVLVAPAGQSATPAAPPAERSNPLP